MMDRYTLQDAQDHLQQLINDAQSGRTVQLVPVPLMPKPRRAGSARGLIKMREDFDAPLDDFVEY